MSGKQQAWWRHHQLYSGLRQDFVCSIFFMAHCHRGYLGQRILSGLDIRLVGYKFKSQHYQAALSKALNLHLRCCVNGLM